MAADVEARCPVAGLRRDCPNRYLAVTHGGATLAGIPGELAATAILDGVEVLPLAPFRPARFAPA